MTLMKGYLQTQITDVALKSDSNEVFSSEEFVDILEQFKCRSLINRKSISEGVQELAKQELYQKPHLIASCWSSIFVPLRLELPGSESLRKLHQDLEPTSKKLVAIKPENEVKRECLLFIKKYVNSLDKPMLKQLLEFLTGSQFLIVDEIKVSFTKICNKSYCSYMWAMLRFNSNLQQLLRAKRRICFYLEQINLGDGNSITLTTGVNILYFTYALAVGFIFSFVFFNF